jgi:site-specific DNA-methyltransferase (adenine-specific)
MTEPRIEKIGDAILYLGDCYTILPTLPPVDAVVTDPPYGINLQPQTRRDYKGRATNWAPIVGDDRAFDPSPLLRFPEVIMWGANYYSDKLPVGDWLAWDKRCSERADAMIGEPMELAWKSNGVGKVRIKRLQHGGVINADSISGNNAARMHPTQKPVGLMEWCLGFLPKARTILDPFMGSGTQGVACANLGRAFIGVEIDPAHFEIACERIAAAYAQGRLFA